MTSESATAEIFDDKIVSKDRLTITSAFSVIGGCAVAATGFVIESFDSALGVDVPNSLTVPAIGAGASLFTLGAYALVKLSGKN